MVDLLNEAEKFLWIPSAVDWRKIRELRNIAAHEYAMEDLQGMYKELLRLAPLVIGVPNA